MKDERGFTLPELLIAIAILAVVITPLSLATVAGLSSTQEVDTRILQGHSRNLLATYLVPDVNSAQIVAVTPGDLPIAIPAASSCFEAGTELQLRAGTDVITYDRVPSSTGDHLLRRERDMTCAVLSESTVATQLSDVSATCAPSPCVLVSEVALQITDTLGENSAVAALRRAGV